MLINLLVFLLIRQDLFFEYEFLIDFPGQGLMKHTINVSSKIYAYFSLKWNES